MRHNSVDMILGGVDKRIFKVRNFLAILSILTNFASCHFFYSGLGVAEVQITGRKYIEKQEIFHLLGLEMDTPIPEEKLTSLKDWEKRLESHPRIVGAKIVRKQARLEISIQEREVDAIVHLDGRFYEIDSEYRVISVDDVRKVWVPILTGSFKLQNNRMEGTNFYAIHEQAEKMFLEFPDIKNRISEIELRKDGDIFIYTHIPVRMTVNIGNFLSNKQARKLYSSLAYMEAESIRPQFLDLRGEDAFYY
jgi:hypothetical protein